MIRNEINKMEFFNNNKNSKLISILKPIYYISSKIKFTISIGKFLLRCGYVRLHWASIINVCEWEMRGGQSHIQHVIYSSSKDELLIHFPGHKGLGDQRTKMIILMRNGTWTNILFKRRKI